MNKFKEGKPVVWRNELCKVLMVAETICVVRNIHRDKTMTIEKSDLREPKPGEFLESNTLSGPEDSDGPTILTKSKGVSNGE